jgi:hypothetical protein
LAGAEPGAEKQKRQTALDQADGGLRTRSHGCRVSSFDRREQAFSEAQEAVAANPIASAADLHVMAACSAIYDAVELNRHNRAPIARVVAQEYFRLGKAVQA